MAQELVMPRLSDSMEEGTILRWLKEEGELVKRGEELVEIESDKASMPYAADLEGYLEIVAAVGDTLPVGAAIARLHAEPPPTRPSPGAGAQEGRPTAPPAVPKPSAGEAATAQGAARVRASPLARRIAAQRGVDLATVTGTGPEGRVVKADVERALTASPTQPAGPAAPVAPAPVVGAKGATQLYPLSRPQQVVARRMAESKATVPHFTLTAEVDMEGCVELRTALRKQARGEPVPTYNDMLVKACAVALREHPRLNATYRDGKLELHGRVNIGFAVAANLEQELQGSLVVPTVFDADLASLGTIATRTRELAQRVREGKVRPPELAGATFTVSNLGAFGIRAFAAIINPPQVAILAAGEVAQRAVVYQGALSARHRIELTLSLDHRAVYGAEGAAFLARVKELLEDPTGLAL